MRQVPILMYHWFRLAGTPSRSRSPQLEISPLVFERQMSDLARRGYRTVTLAEAVGRDRSALPERPVVITFDDGTLDFWEYARPVLQRWKMTATLFVVTGHVGFESDWDLDLGEPARPLLDWDQIAQLQQEGHEIGSHGHRHRPLTTLSDDEVREELARSRDILAERLGHAPAFFAYPRGFHTAEHTGMVREAGYRGACGVILRWRDLWRADPYRLKRVTIKGSESLFRFRTRLKLTQLISYSDRAAAQGGTRR